MFASVVTAFASLFADTGIAGEWPAAAWVGLGVVAVALAVLLACELLGMGYIPNNAVGIVEKLWSAKGSAPKGASSSSAAKLVCKRRCCAVAHTLDSGGGNIGFTRSLS